VTVGQEVKTSPHGSADPVKRESESGDDSYRRRESFEGQRDIAGIREETTGETTMNPRVVSRCNSADRIDEEKADEVV
jgi:hypothetical protein